ncbi:MAG: ABC transporter substrate-binding protein [Anaerolineales bacterium]
MRKIAIALLLIGALALGACTAAEEATEVPAPTEPPPPATEAPEPEPEPTVDEGMSNCETGYVGETMTWYSQAGLTGALATILGPSFVNGTQDAIEDINAEGGVCGVQVDLNLTDTQYDPEQEIAAYEVNRAADPKPMFILTYASPATIVLKDRVVEDHIVNFAAGLNAAAAYDPADGWTVLLAPIYSDQFAGFVKWVSDNWDSVKPEGAGDDIVVGVVGWEGSFGAGATTENSIAYAESIGATVLPLETIPVSPEADPTGAIQNLQLSGANVIYIQNLGFGTAQVIGTIRALGVWDDFVVGGVNWTMNQDVLTILGDSAAAMNGYYAPTSFLWWNDTDDPGVQQVLEAFEARDYPESDKQVGYLISYGGIMAAASIVEDAINEVGFENLDGDAFFDAMKARGLVSGPAAPYLFDVRDGNRAPNQVQIRQAQAGADGVEFVVVEDFFELPDTRPGG